MFLEQARADGLSSPSANDFSVRLVKPTIPAFKIRAPKKSENMLAPIEKSRDPSPGTYNEGTQFKKIYDKAISFSFSKDKANPGKLRALLHLF